MPIRLQSINRTIVPLRLRSTTSACIVLLQQTAVLPCHSRRDNNRASTPTITRPIDSPSSTFDLLLQDNR
ncbi:uncharacterized protein K441DRAFT_659717 [Cenococcum geophilum 1.58]|uniref:uncharacterized protein n=1 Tax=Cenococcum geophilum 1.58 TaxID=794803 RepID=UPI00358E4B76|nr:hypothetical protein K441DRAFT_659717 [Cenococcum geophilum 1.58]